MLQFAAPLGLLALGALVVPVLIHLVRRPRRVVRVGSLRFLEDGRRPVRSWRWHEGLLLALRCALLAALALALAGIRWQPRPPAPARWLLLAPGAILDAAGRAEWERLRAEGFEPRGLAPGFPRLDPTRAPGMTGHDLDAWSLLRETDLRLPADSRVVVFGPTWSAQFRGARPQLANVAVSWRATAGEAALRTAPPPARVGLVAAPDREEDARYLRAAFAAIGATVVSSEAPDWVFQLGEVALPTAWQEHVENGARLVTDAPNGAAVVRVARWLDAGGSSVRLRQRSASGAGAPVGRDSAGEAFVTAERRGAGWHWRFAFRFHPDWTDWPIESAFPAWWRTHLHPPAEAPVRIAPEQAAPRHVPARASARSGLAGYGGVDLRSACWWVAVVLSGLERAWSFAVQRRRTKS